MFVDKIGAGDKREESGEGWQDRSARLIEDRRSVDVECEWVSPWVCVATDSNPPRKTLQFSLFSPHEFLAFFASPMQIARRYNHVGTEQSVIKPVFVDFYIYPISANKTRHDWWNGEMARKLRILEYRFGFVWVARDAGDREQGQGRLCVDARRRDTRENASIRRYSHHRWRNHTTRACVGLARGNVEAINSINRP